MYKLYKYCFIVLLIFGVNAVHAQNNPYLSKEQLIEKGKYIATAADCAACHAGTDKKQSPYAGGYTITSALGDIIATNITPSKSHGIGNYTEQQFAEALRKGVAADGRYLYPAMPFTAYAKMKDSDVKALYAYLMNEVEPVNSSPKKTTNLGFPFSIRQLMFGWDLLFSNEQPFQADEKQSSVLNRGQYLVDALGHCSTCHTPRNTFMAENKDQYLSGAELAGWYAPNITSDKETGIGKWSQQQIATYLKTGHTVERGQAAGPMAEAVEYSLRFLSDEDINAMAEYLKSVPPIETKHATFLKNNSVSLPSSNKITDGQTSENSLTNSTTLDGATLYDSACASCHGRDGEGTADHFYPSLTQNSTVTAPQPNNLVMSILKGVSRKGHEYNVLMPAFEHELSSAQVAQVANFVRLQFASIDDKLDAEDIDRIEKGVQAPFLIRHITVITLAVLLLLILAGVIIWGKRSKK